MNPIVGSTITVDVRFLDEDGIPHLPASTSFVFQAPDGTHHVPAVTLEDVTYTLHQEALMVGLWYLRAEGETGGVVQASEMVVCVDPTSISPEPDE